MIVPEGAVCKIDFFLGLCEGFEVLVCDKLVYSMDAFGAECLPVEWFVVYGDVGIIPDRGPYVDIGRYF